MFYRCALEEGHPGPHTPHGPPKSRSSSKGPRVCTSCQEERHARCIEYIEGFLCDCPRCIPTRRELRPLRYKSWPNPYNLKSPDPYASLTERESDGQP
jgi:hypothetical protein